MWLTEQVRRVVLSLHGIESRGDWQKQATPTLASEGWIPYPLDYGSFSKWSLTNPLSRRERIEWFVGQYQHIRQAEGIDRPSVIAHSFGSFLVAAALDKYDYIKFDKVVFCGAIVHPRFPWTRIFARDQVNAVLNEHGANDFWAGIVGLVVKNAGPSGRSGFVPHDGVENHLFERFGHSDYFKIGHYQSHWIPFIRRICLRGDELAGARDVMDILAGSLARTLETQRDHLRISVMAETGDRMRIVPDLHYGYAQDDAELELEIPVGSLPPGKAFASARTFANVASAGWLDAELPSQ